MRYGDKLYVASRAISKGTNINDAITVGYFVETDLVRKINGVVNNLIKTDTATVTTDASGNAMLPLSREKILVSVYCTSHNGVRCMTMTANNNWYVFPLANSLTFSPYENKSMTFKYYYV